MSVFHPILLQIATPGREFAVSNAGRAGICVLGQHQQGDPRPGLVKDVGDVDTGGPIAEGDVDEGDIRVEAVGLLESSGAGGCHGHHEALR